MIAVLALVVPLDLLVFVIRQLPLVQVPTSDRRNCTPTFQTVKAPWASAIQHGTPS